MMNLIPSTKNPIDFHKAVIAKKRDSTLRSRLTAIDAIIAQDFAVYENRFLNNNLESLVATVHSDETKADLLSLYSYKNSLITSIKNEVTTTVTNRKIATCQNCTIGEGSSLDHLVPKEEFNSFAVNPLNLFPSCTSCNSRKGRFWLSGGRRKFLNLYLDILPDVQYLFPTVQLINGDFTVIYEVDNRNGINHQLFRTIESHYRALNLCARFTENLDKVIPKLITSIKPSRRLMSRADIVRTSLETATENQDLYGFNYWYSITEIELLNSQAFMDYVYSLP